MMMRGAVIAGGAVLAVLAVAALAVAIVNTGLFNTKYDEVAARWAAPPSRFIMIDGARVHVRDEGSGPVIVMLHGSYMNLHLWDPWVERLRKDHRIIRLDWAPWGLTTDAKREYSPARAEQLLAGVIDALGVKRFVGVGTSNGANIMTAYAVHHPGRVQALALSTVPVFLPYATQYRHPRVEAMRWIHANLTPDYYPRFYYSWFIDDIIHRKDRITPKFVDMYYEMNNIRGKSAGEAMLVKENLATVTSGLTVENARAITIPVLIQWGDANTVLLPEQGDKVAAAYAQAPVTMIHYQDVAHYPMWEIPERTVADFRAFLARHGLSGTNAAVK